MKDYTDVNGDTFTDADLEKWAADAEAGTPYGGKHLGASRPGRPVSVGERARPFTLRLDADRRAKLDREARARGITPSRLMRDLVDAL